jgi:UDPglucose--hexose-1-phosphate uridylyltransferase
MLIDVLGRLDRLFDAPMPYMMWFHQRPTDGGEWPNAWLHAHIAPLYRAAGTQRFVAAGELGSGVFFNPVDPADAAARLREV